LATNAAVTPLSAFSSHKAVQLLQDKFACLGCHRLGDRGGALGPDLSAAAGRLQPAYVQGIIADPRRVAPHSIMPQIPMPAESVELIARCLLTSGWPSVTHRYLTHLPLDVVSPAAGLASPDRSAGANYLRHCAACHGVAGRGDGWNASFLVPAKPTVFADANYLAQRPDDTLFDGIHSGARVLNRSPLMPPWATIFSGPEIRELVRHLRTLCRCDGPEWSRNPSAP
jgi:mono/diheme cytochrome c family protein